MMGESLLMQENLFYEFRLEDHVPPITCCSTSIALLTPLNFASTTGRPSIGPKLMIRMLLIGYCFGIRRNKNGSRQLPSLNEKGPARMPP